MFTNLKNRRMAEKLLKEEAIDLSNA